MTLNSLPYKFMILDMNLYLVCNIITALLTDILYPVNKFPGYTLIA